MAEIHISTILTRLLLVDILVEKQAGYYYE
jgi:hypothetical protein